jgi:hypothetical protein
VKSGRTIVISLLAALGGLLLVYYYFTASEEGNKYQWSQNYRAASDQPYGLKFLKEMLESYRPESNFIMNERKMLKKLLDSASLSGNADYVFIGQSMFLNSEDAEALVNFMRAGNDAFIASDEAPADIISRVYFKECNAELQYTVPEVTESLIANFYHDTLRRETGYAYRYRYGAENYPYNWQHITPAIFCDSTRSVIPLGSHQSVNVNFIKIPVDKGNLYLHCNPLLFTNYFLTKEDKVEYAAGVFSHLSGNDIIWDEYSKVPMSNKKNPYDSPLYYILQQPALKYAWWLLLITVILYVLFAAKRKQRVIPVLETKSNTSLEYINLISTLHYQNGNHLDMAKKKMKYFLYFVRSRYGISTDSINEQHIKRIAEKSRMNIEDVKIIFDQYHFLESKFSENIEANRLLNLYYAIENFYQKCK